MNAANQGCVKYMGDSQERWELDREDTSFTN